MKRIVFAAALVGAAPLQAQGLGTQAQNLDCAIWSSSAIGQTDEREAQASYGFMLAYFIGLYEGAAGKTIDDALVQRTTELSPVQIDSMGEQCIARAQTFSERLAALSQRLIAIGK